MKRTFTRDRNALYYKGRYLVMSISLQKWLEDNLTTLHFSVSTEPAAGRHLRYAGSADHRILYYFDVHHPWRGAIAICKFEVLRIFKTAPRNLYITQLL